MEGIMSLVTCNLQGPSRAHFGLGNQMFGVATALSYAKDHNKAAIFPCLNNSMKYGGYQKTVFSKLDLASPPSDVRFTHYREPNFSYNGIPRAENLLLEGYFQSEKYFVHNRKVILDTFEFPEGMRNYIYLKYSRLIDMDNTVSVHVRRGDYITDFNGCFEILDNEYYDEAFNRFPENSVFVFFGEHPEDLEHCKEVMNTKRAFYIREESDIADLYLMSKMKSNIIANSSFSWWAAWLNTHEDKKIIAPQKWFGSEHPTLSNSDKVTKDLIPVAWERI